MATLPAISDRPGRALPTTTSVASSATSVTLVPANNSRLGFSVTNASTALLYLSYTTPATTSNAFAIVASNGNYDAPFPVGNAIYGIWSAANGTAQITEYV